MSLDKYWKKRDFDKTPEPRGQAAKSQKQLAFFIQKHDARRLHYDFRLELEGTLKSWAVPKGPSLNPGDKRLAVHVEDHPMDYGTFEGSIPAHQYGAGTVLLWDRGIWVPEGDELAGYRKGRLKFQLQGEKLSGGWTLVRMGPPKDEKENWLLIKERDDAARTGEEADITTLRPESVATTKNKKASRAPKSPESPESPAAKTPRKKNIAIKTPAIKQEIQGAVATPLPNEMKPQLATLSQQAPDGDDWLSEVKFDGYRALCRIEHGRAQLFTRAGNDWTKKWAGIADAAAALPVEQAWLDGEVVAISEDGSISFQALQNMARHEKAARLAYYIFDLVYLNGYDLSEVPLLERKRLLKTLLADVDPDGAIFYSDHIVGDSQNVFAHACMHNLEGIVVKRADAAYTQSRGRSWLKVKCQHRQEFVIGGYTDPAGSRAGFGALLLGVYDNNQQLHYSGRVGTGFDTELLEDLSKKFAKLGQKTSPFNNPPTGAEARGVHWLKPELIGEVSFAEWTESGVIRHASFVGLRTDKPGREIVREIPLTKAELPRADAATPVKVKPNVLADKLDKPVSKDARVAGVALSNPSRVLFPDVGWTKLDLAHYYENVAEWILPHLRKRPLTLVRCPHGGGSQCFFQKHVKESIPREVDHVEVPEDDGTATYMMANRLPAIIGLVQMGVLELHTWGSQEGHLDLPDRIIFDLDPAPDLGWIQVIEAAQLIRALLEEIGLKSFVKTTGGKGLHVAVPIKPERPWPEIKAFTRAVAEHLAVTLPERFTSKITKAKRTNKIFIDYLRNASGATAVAAFSTRARPNAPVSVPITWEELDADLHSDTFTVGNIEQRLSQIKEDPWAEYFELKQRVTATMLRKFGLP